MGMKKPEDAATAVGGKPKMWAGVEPTPGEVAAVAPKAVPPSFRLKKGGVIPPKRKLVKTMMLESILNFITSLFRRRGNPSSVGDSPSTPPSVTPNGNGKKEKISDSA